MIEISVVLPSKNEEETIGMCIKKIRKVFDDLSMNGEIIVADNSTDRTPDIARSLGAKVVVPDKLGYGYAYRFGFSHASGNYLVMGDADGTYDFADIPRLLERLIRNKADIVIGSRFKGRIKEGAMPRLHRYIGNPVLTWILNRLFRTDVSDAHSGFRVFTKEAYQKMDLNTHGMEFASEMIIKSAKNNLKFAEVPITYHPRPETSEANLRSFPDGWRHLKFMLANCPMFSIFAVWNSERS